jgi:hypothetical protein
MLARAATEASLVIGVVIRIWPINMTVKTVGVAGVEEELKRKVLHADMARRHSEHEGKVQRAGEAVASGRLEVESELREGERARFFGEGAERGASELALNPFTQRVDKAGAIKNVVARVIYRRMLSIKRIEGEGGSGGGGGRVGENEGEGEACRSVASKGGWEGGRSEAENFGAVELERVAAVLAFGCARGQHRGEIKADEGELVVIWIQEESLVRGYEAPAWRRGRCLLELQRETHSREREGLHELVIVVKVHAEQPPGWRADHLSPVK